MSGDVCTIVVKPDVFEWLTRTADEPNLEGETRELKVARIPRTGSHHVGEGICAVCGLVVPIWKANHKILTHWPDHAEDSYSDNIEYYCRGSNEDPAELLGPSQRLTVYTIEWEDGTTAEDVQRLSRSWAAAVSAKDPVAMVNLRIFNSERRA